MNFLIYDDATLTAFRESQAELLALVERLVAKARAQNLWEDLTCIAVQPAGDLADLLGAEPVEWDWQHSHGTWLESGTTAGTAGFAWIVLTSRTG
jgi:hypothetical protein